MISVHAPDGVPEVRHGDDLVDLVLAALEPDDGDVLVVTSKVVSKAEGRVRRGTREDALAGETERVVARRGPTTIVRTRHGLTLAAAGIDASNVASGHVVLLPEDPDTSARALRAGIRDRTGRNVGVVVTDTAGRAWREGQTDIAVGAAGLRVLDDHSGRTDAHGNELAVTAPAVADEIASAAELAQGKLAGRPFALLRGRADLVLAPGEDGPGARGLVRPDGADLFGYGAREAVVRAVRGDADDRTAFGTPSTAEELVVAFRSASPTLTAVVDGGEVVVSSTPHAQVSLLAAVAFAHGWTAPDTVDDEPKTADVRFRPGTP